MNTDSKDKDAGIKQVSLSPSLLGDICELIESARQRVATAVNAGLTILYWQIGARIRQDILKEYRAEYGSGIVATLSNQLSMEYGRGFTRRNLFNMIRFVEVFPDEKIVHALSAQLTWTHFREIIYLIKQGMVFLIYCFNNSFHITSA